MEGKKYFVGDNFIVSHVDGKVAVTDMDGLWCVAMSENIAMAQAILSWDYDKDGRAIKPEGLMLCLNQMFFATTVPGDTEYIGERERIDTQYMARLDERSREVKEKEVATVLSLAMDRHDGNI